MTLTIEERSLIILYYSGSRQETISALWEALPDIDDSVTLISAWNAIGKLGATSDAEFTSDFGQEVLENAG